MAVVTYYIISVVLTIWYGLMVLNSGSRLFPYTIIERLFKFNKSLNKYLYIVTVIITMWLILEFWPIVLITLFIYNTKKQKD